LPHDTVGILQTPAPSHIPAGVLVEPVHMAALQTVVVPKKRQAPAPLQLPSRPHDIGVAAVHWFNRSCPVGIGVQVPTLPASAHDMQVVEQAALQHTPCAQNPELQSVPAAQSAPTGFLPQLPARQTPAVQSASFVHAVRHAAVAAQAYGAQVCGWAGMQPAASLQREAAVSWLPTQVPSPQTVPTG
jgi:hypothetical protein